jgi:hypothetical protein
MPRLSPPLEANLFKIDRPQKGATDMERGRYQKKAPAAGLGGFGSWGFLIFETRTRLVITGTMTAERFKFRLLL